MKHSIYSIACIFTLSGIHAESSEELFSRAVAHTRAGDTQQALNLYNQFLEHHPNSLQAVYNIAYTYKDAGQYHKALPHYQTVLQREPGHQFAHFGLAQCYLAIGEFEKSWPHYEYRCPEIKNFTEYDFTLGTDLRGIRVLIRVEWAMGDNILFVRYARELKCCGATVIVQTHSALRDLFEQCPYIDQVIITGDAFPEHDIQIPMMSLSKTFNTTVRTIPNTMPYMFARDDLIDRWQQQLSADTNLKIGICWHGSIDSATCLPSHCKNIPLNMLLGLADIPNITLYSLQRVGALEELEGVDHPSLVIFDENFDRTNGRFMDTAAVMRNLDVVITIDTSLAHLAGALDVPVWVMLPYKADWRWELADTTTPWYPNMRLFRQREPGNWHTVIETLKEELTTLHIDHTS